MSDSPPIPGGDTRWALFLDVDGTLLEPVEHPDAAVVPAVLVERLRSLRGLLDGALALVSGRSIGALDRLFGPGWLDVAGCHGAEWRIGGSVGYLPTGDRLGRVAACLSALIADRSGCFCETKTGAVALRFQTAFVRRDEARALAERAIREAIGGEGTGFRLLEGRSVIDILPSGADKGMAICRLLANPRYRGRRPVFLGDDVTDETGFAEVQRRDGLSIRIGDPVGPSVARYRLISVSAAHLWLAAFEAALAAWRHGPRAAGDVLASGSQ